MKTSRPRDNMTRRNFVATGTACAAGGLLGDATVAGAPANSGGPPARPSVYEAIGVKHVINAAGKFTVLGGSLMSLEVVAAWVDASRSFVDLMELQDRVEEQIARLVGIEAALVTTGAAGALLLGTAAAVTGTDHDRIARLPNTAGMKCEVILQKSHHSCYDNQLTDVGVKLLEVTTREELEQAISETTALMFFMNYAEPDGRISRDEWLEVARRHDVPTLLDAAADVPPVARLSEYNNMGFDMVAFSGGKAMRGPNDTGLLVGRKSLIDAAKLNANPHCGTIGRMMKVSKEDMIALLAAVERYVRTDHEAEWREWERRISSIEHALRNIPTVRSERVVPPIANHVPHLIVVWDEQRVQITPAEVGKQLRSGDPPIRIDRVHHTGNEGISISVFMLAKGEDQIVAARLHEILAGA